MLLQFIMYAWPMTALLMILYDIDRDRLRFCPVAGADRPCRHGQSHPDGWPPLFHQVGRGAGTHGFLARRLIIALFTPLSTLP